MLKERFSSNSLFKVIMFFFRDICLKLFYNSKVGFLRAYKHRKPGLELR